MTLLDHLPSWHEAVHPRMDPSVWPADLHHDIRGRLVMSGVALCDIADEFGTPAYVIDEADLQRRAHTYHRELPEAEIAYPGKPLLVGAAARWIRSEGLSIDVGSRGELAATLAGGVDPARIIVHGGGANPDDLRAALSARVGRIVVNSREEIVSLSTLLEHRQQVLIGINPDLDLLRPPVDVPATEGFSIATGEADRAVLLILCRYRFELVGLHCDLSRAAGDGERCRAVVSCLIAQMNRIRSEHAVVLTELDLTGGRTPLGPVIGRPLDVRELAESIDDAIDDACTDFRFPRPRLILGPGPAVVSRSAVTLYRVCAVERTPGDRTVVLVEAGTGTNPDAALRNSRQTVVLANRHAHGHPEEVTVLSARRRHGDDVAAGVLLPADVHPGDVLAVACRAGYETKAQPRAIAVCHGVARLVDRL